MALECLRPLCQCYNANSPFFNNLAILLFSEIVTFMIKTESTRSSSNSGQKPNTMIIYILLQTSVGLF